VRGADDLAGPGDDALQQAAGAALLGQAQRGLVQGGQVRPVDLLALLGLVALWFHLGAHGPPPSSRSRAPPNLVAAGWS
jgi:hypothetical protein